MASTREVIAKAFDEQEDFIGTERQCEWAEHISEQKLPEVVKMLSVMANQLKSDDMSIGEYKEAVRRAVVMIKETRAEWWINHRDDEVHYLLAGSPLGFFRQ